jgi:hypothetical protein
VVTFVSKALTDVEKRYSQVEKEAYAVVWACERSSIVEHRNWQQEMNKYLRSYRSTPHSTTGISPSKLLFGRDLTCRLPDVEVQVNESATTTQALKRDEAFKLKSSEYQNKRRRVQQTLFKPGDKVFVRQKRSNKYMTTFASEVHVVSEVHGCMITVVASNGRRFARNASCFKKVSTVDVQVGESTKRTVNWPNHAVTEVHESPEPRTRDTTEEIIGKGVAPVIVRSSTRVKMKPDKYGEWTT